MFNPRRCIAPALALGLISPAALASAAADAAPAIPQIDHNPGATPIDPEVLYLRTGEIRLPENPAPLADLARPAAADAVPTHYVIQLRGPMTAARRAALEDAGVRLMDHLPANAYIARFDGADPERLAAIDFVRWYGPYQQAWKIDPEVGRQNFTTPQRLALAKEGKTQLWITLFDGQRPAAVADRIAALPGVQIHWMDMLDGNGVILATVALADAPAIAAMAEVQFIEEAPEMTERSNSDNRWVVQTNQSGVTPFYAAGIHGEGQIVGIIDSRIRTDHCSFSDTAPIGPNHRKILALNAPSGTPASHGTHVAGTVVGDSGTDNDLRGVAYLGRLVHNVIPSFNETAIFNMLTTHHNQGARVHTNSWGNDGTTSYDGLCRGFDNFLWLNEDSMVTLAVTNQSVLKNPENAKNLLACGATDAVPQQTNHCSGGIGPTTDLRRKPELYAPGCNTISANSGSACGTRSLSGTSMATPAIAGAAMLARQYFTDGYYPSGLANPADGFIPSGALIKAALLNSAVDMTGITGYPSNLEGWGRVLLDNTFYFAGGSDTRRMFITDVRNAEGLSTGGVAEQVIEVLSGSEPLVITVAWTEPPAAAGASLATVNDLDLIVTAPDGSVYRGNVFANGQSTTGGTADARNNVEQVRVSAPTPGPWSVRIEGAAVNVATQGYALVASGDIQGAPAGLAVTLASAVPSLVPPGVPQTINVNINPGDDTLVPGSPILAYRFDPSAPFTIVPLTFVSGTTWTASIPYARCGETPQFYVSAEGEASGVRTAPLSAPEATYSYDVGVIASDTIVEEHFDALPAGWSATGLWHIQSTCAADSACDGPNWIAYNQDSTCTYNTGVANHGDLISPPITIPTPPPGRVVTLSYCSTLITEDVGTWDSAQLFLGELMIDEAEESADWQTRTVDLTNFAGQEIQLRFNFNTGDATANNFRGWQVDHLRITVTGPTCPDSCIADANGDNSVNSADISAFLSRWLADLNEGALNADANRDGVTNSADISAFLSLWLEAITSGC